MVYKVNISNTTVTKERAVEVADDRKPIGCIHATCFNVDCEDCIFDQNRVYYISELIKRTKL